MKSKLYKTHRKASYYRLRRLGYFSMSLMVATIIVVVPLTLAQASTTSSVTISSTSIASSSLSSSASDSSSAVSSEAPTAIEMTYGGQDLTLKLVMVFNP